MKSVVLFVATLLLFVSSCKTPQTGNATITVVDTLTTSESKRLIKDKQLFSSITETVPIDTLYILKDTLHIVTKKIAGCDTDAFSLFWNGNTTKSLPPQAGVKLFQQVDAACNERHYFHLLYTLDHLKNKPVADGTAKSSVVLKIGGWNTALLYEY